MFKTVILSAIMGMVFPLLGHAAGHRLKNDWLRFSVSIIFLILSIIISYTIAIKLNWCD
jgi:putative Ca2+/H+ antiporter (TMEM165/GDT1 family)